MLQFQNTFLDGCSQTDPLVADVVLAVVLAQEDVSQDPEAAGGGQTHEPGQAEGLASLLDLQDVVLALQGVVLAAESEVDDGQAGDLGAVDHALAGQGVDLGTDGLVDGLDVAGGAGDQAGAGVHDGLAAVGACHALVAVDRDTVHVDLPVGGLAQGNVVHLTSVQVLVRSAQNELSTVGIIGVPVKVE